MKQRIFLRAMSFFTAFCMFFCYNIPICAKENGIRVSLECRMTETEEYELSLTLSSAQGLCGLLCELKYDENAFLYLGGGSDCALELTYLDISSGVRFILDGSENCESECILARFYFKRIGSGESGFELSCIGESSVVYFNEAGELINSNAILSGCTVIGNASSEPSVEVPKFESFELFERGDERVISFEVKVGNGNFAAGARLFLLDLESGESEDVRVVGIVSPTGIFKGEYILSGQKKIAISATALGYRRDSEIRGERKTGITLRSIKLHFNQSLPPAGEGGPLAVDEGAKKVIVNSENRF